MNNQQIPANTMAFYAESTKLERERNDDDTNHSNQDDDISDEGAKIHHSAMIHKIAAENVFRSNIPILLIIGVSEAGKSGFASVAGSNPESTTIFEDWNEVREKIDSEILSLNQQNKDHRQADEVLAKPMFQKLNSGLANGEGENIFKLEDVTKNRPRSVKYTNLIEENFGKLDILVRVLNGCVSVMETKKLNGKMYKPGEIPVVYYNESLKDATFHYDAFFLIVTEGQESGGSKHRITLQVRNKVTSRSNAKKTKAQKILGDKYIQDPTFGEMYATNYPVDLMMYFSMLGPVKVTSVNSSTFSAKNVTSLTQKGGMSDSVVNTPNYLSNIVSKWGGRLILEIRDDWDKADTLFGSGDMAIEISKVETGKTRIKRFRMRDGSLGQKEYFTTKLLYEIICSLVVHCIDSDLLEDLRLLQSVVKFFDTFIIFSENEKRKIENMLKDEDTLNIEVDVVYIGKMNLALEGYVSDCNRRNMSTEAKKFKDIKDIYEE